MGVRGPRPRPTHLKLLDGNPGKRALNQNEPKPEGDLTDPPEELNDDQKAIWRATMADAPLGLLKRLDRELFRSWVVAADMYHRAVAALNANPALIVRTRNGEPIQNPYIAIVNKQALMMHRAGEQMGFSPSSRTRIALDPEGDGASKNPFNKFAKR